MKQPILTGFLLLIERKDWRSLNHISQLLSSRKSVREKKNPFILHLSYSSGQNWKEGKKYMIMHRKHCSHPAFPDPKEFPQHDSRLCMKICKVGSNRHPIYKDAWGKGVGYQTRWTGPALPNIWEMDYCSCLWRDKKYSCKRGSEDTDKSLSVEIAKITT